MSSFDPTFIWLIDTITHDLDRALHYTMLWGLDGIEIGAVGRATDRVPHVDEAKLRRRMQEHGLSVEAVTPGLFEGSASARAVWMNELLELEETLDFCKRIGCARIVASAFSEGTAEQTAEALRKAGEAAESRGITICVLNESGSYPKGADLAALLEAVGHPNVRAAWQPAVALETGEDPAAGLGLLHPALVRCADRVREGGRWLPAPLGEGEVGYEAQFEQLRYKGFDGTLSLLPDVEPTRGRGPTDGAKRSKPLYGLRAATRLIEMVRAG